MVTGRGAAPHAGGAGHARRVHREPTVGGARRLRRSRRGAAGLFRAEQPGRPRHLQRQHVPVSADPIRLILSPTTCPLGCGPCGKRDQVRALGQSNRQVLGTRSRSATRTLTRCLCTVAVAAARCTTTSRTVARSTSAAPLGRAARPTSRCSGETRRRCLTSSSCRRCATTPTRGASRARGLYSSSRVRCLHALFFCRVIVSCCSKLWPTVSFVAGLHCSRLGWVVCSQGAADGGGDGRAGRACRGGRGCHR